MCTARDLELEASIIARAIQGELVDKGAWQGTATDLLSKLRTQIGKEDHRGCHE